MTWAESETLEFKASFSEWKEAVQTLCAFANAKGATVAVGIDDAGQPTALEIGKGSIEDLLNKVRLNTDPVLYPSVAVRTFGSETCLEIQVPESETKAALHAGLIERAIPDKPSSRLQKYRKVATLPAMGKS